jgi:hypothetical protein
LIGNIIILDRDKFRFVTNLGGENMTLTFAQAQTIQNFAPAKMKQLNNWEFPGTQ